MEEEEKKEVRGERRGGRREKNRSTCTRQKRNFHKFLNLTPQLPAFSNVLLTDASVTWTYL